jgi:hypothetical protein
MRALSAHNAIISCIPIMVPSLLRAVYDSHNRLLALPCRLLQSSGLSERLNIPQRSVRRVGLAEMS